MKCEQCKEGFVADYPKYQLTLCIPCLNKANISQYLPKDRKFNIIKIYENYNNDDAKELEGTIVLCSNRKIDQTSMPRFLYEVIQGDKVWPYDAGGTRWLRIATFSID